MTEQTEKIDRIVDGYLGLVERALGGLSEAHRAELLGDLREHIEAERAELTSQSEAAIRVILDRLGDPEEIAAAALSEPGRMPVIAAAPVTAMMPVPPRRLGPLGWSLIGVSAVLVLACVVLTILGLFVRSEDTAPASSVQAPSPSPSVELSSGAVPPSGVVPSGSVSSPAPPPAS